MKINLTVDSEHEMQEFAERLAKIIKVGDWVSLIGGLGVGKTIFAKGFIKSMGFEGEVNSPSYALVHSYDPPSVKLHTTHADLYRIESDIEYHELGLDEVLAYGVALVEWADKYPFTLPSNHFIVNIKKLSENKRDIELKIMGDGVSRWI